MNALISVIVPVYNVEKYLRKCLESIVAQTYKKLEILLIDDGATDDSGRICDEFAEKDARIRVIHKKNEGVSAARNLGMSLCTGEYIMFVDADDYLSEFAVERLYSRLMTDGSDLVVGCYALVYGETITHSTDKIFANDTVLSGEQALAFLGTEWGFRSATWGKLYAKSILTEIVFPPIHYGEDILVYPHILESSRRISVDTNISYFYVQRSDSAVRTKSDEKILECISAILYVAKFLESRQLNQNALRCYRDVVHMAMRVKDRKKARNMIVASMDRDTRNQLIYRDIRILVRWVSLYFPFVFTWVKTMQKVLKKIIKN